MMLSSSRKSHRLCCANCETVLERASQGVRVYDVTLCRTCYDDYVVDERRRRQLSSSSSLGDDKLTFSHEAGCSHVKWVKNNSCDDVSDDDIEKHVSWRDGVVALGFSLLVLLATAAWFGSLYCFVMKISAWLGHGVRA